MMVKYRTKYSKSADQINIFVEISHATMKRPQKKSDLKRPTSKLFKNQKIIEIGQQSFENGGAKVSY